MADHKKLKEQMEKTNDPKEALSIIILHLEKKNRKLQDKLVKEKDITRKLEAENKNLKKDLEQEKETVDFGKWAIGHFKAEQQKLSLKKNAYKKDYQRTKQCLDAALGFVGYEQEKVFSKECLYTLWLEHKAHERNLELARDRERLADGWLLEAACIEEFLRKGGVKKPL